MTAAPIADSGFTRSEPAWRRLAGMRARVVALAVVAAVLLAGCQPRRGAQPPVPAGASEHRISIDGRERTYVRVSKGPTRLILRGSSVFAAQEGRGLWLAD
ncbi:hypothetical protein Cs7R123_12740 [Catellatospora sp. TT07R-123]|nr:hypothetical protein Cs7R123_12740 [Catellatospora sp. TT07R-123]